MTDGTEKKLTKQIVVRVPAGLYEALQKDAADNGRTPAQSVRFLLTKALADEAEAERRRDIDEARAPGAMA